jgi:hypothetical protein
LEQAPVVEVLEVSPSWSAPKDEDWVAVYVLKTGTPPWGGLEGVMDDPPIFTTDNNAPDIASAIDRAKQWARAKGIPVIHVVRGADRRAAI